jgi:hypothetical protein
MLIRHVVLDETQQSLDETQQSLKHRNISKKTASFISLLFSKLNFSQNDEERGSSCLCETIYKRKKRITLFSGTKIKAQ